MILKSKPVLVYENISKLKKLIADPVRLSKYFPESFSIEKTTPKGIDLKAWNINFLMELQDFEKQTAQTQIRYLTSSVLIDFCLECSLQMITSRSTQVQIEISTGKVNPLIKNMMRKNFHKLIEIMTLNFEKIRNSNIETVETQRDE